MSSDKPRIGFIGLGIMGGPMALNAIRAGYPMTVYNRTRARTEPHAEAGADVVDSPAEVAAAVDISFSCVSDSPDVREVVLDEASGVVAGAHEGLVHVDCSTVAPRVGKECHEALAAKGTGFLDAPISGGDVGAREGTLSIMSGGDAEDFERARPVLETMGKTITHCGGPGAGYTVKLCNQILGGLHLLAAAEALNLAEAAEIDVDAMLRAVSSGAAGSWILKNLGHKMAAGDYEPGFFIDYQLKDLRLAHEAAHRLNVPLLGASLAETLIRAASARGHGRDGTQALVEVVRALRRKEG